MNERRTPTIALAIAALAAACDEGAPGAVDAATQRPPTASTPTCTLATEAPLRTDVGDRRCAPVGASVTPSTNPWPDTQGMPEPVVYVRPGASGPGTRDAPYGDVAMALRGSPSPATVVLSRGTHVLVATLALERDATLVGVGAADTTLVAPAGMPAVTVRATTTAVVTIVGLAVRYDAAPAGAPPPAALSVTGERASLRVRDVAVERPGRGLLAAEGGVLCAERVTVRGAAGSGVSIQGGAHGYLRRIAVREGLGAGVSAGRSHLSLRESLVANNAWDGVSIVGTASDAACSDDAGCPTAAACEGFLTDASHVRVCAALSQAGAAPSRCVGVQDLRDVAVIGNGVVGVRAQRARPTDAEVAAGSGGAVFAAPGPVLRAARLVVAGTRAPAEGPGGDGIYVGPGATLSLDADASPTHDTVGRLSEVTANDRVGVLVDGDPSTDATVPNANRVGGRMDAQGARVLSNRGPGLFAQNRASVSRFAYSLVGDNAAVGFGVTTGASVAFFLDDQFVDTRTATLALTSGTATVRVTVGDGVSIAEPGSEAFFLDDQFIGNERVGLLVAGGAVRLSGANTGARNGFGVAALAGATVTGASTDIRGAITTVPSTLAYVRDGLSRSTAAP